MSKNGSADHEKVAPEVSVYGRGTQPEPEPSSGRRCHDCGIISPETETSYTLISSRYGWRLELISDLAGQKVSIWRCPDCWRNRRAGKHSSPKLR
jgi:hypothetical protein